MSAEVDTAKIREHSCRTLCTTCILLLESSAYEIDVLRARCRDLETALQPFAEGISEVDEADHDDGLVRWTVQVVDFRRAVAALGEQS